jgi:TolB-like protein/Flp pilus assembly protein TadD
MGEDEEGTLAALKAIRRELSDPKVKEHRGRIVKTTGDGLLIEFSSVVDAVRCAVDVQRAMAERNAEVPEEKRITFRIGVNLGDVIIDGDDIYGDGVNIAARLEALAEPGGICISRVVRDQIRDKLLYPLEDMGEKSVKNIARPVRTYAMSATAVASTALAAAPAEPGPARRRISLQRAVIAGSLVAVFGIGIAGWWVWQKENSPRTSPQAPTALSPQSPPAIKSTPAPRLSFVVLPFANLSTDPDQEYFADGITDDLTTDLSRISDSFVIARNTAFTYKGKSVDAKQVGRELGVRYILEGSVRRAGDQVRVNVQLIDAETGAHLWADRFETDRANLAEAQNEITGRLARSLHREIVQNEGRRIEQEKAVDPDSRDLVMRGWAILQRPISLANREEARQSFERALGIDPRSIDARIGIASVLVFNIIEGWSTSVQQDQARAEQLLLEAIERDANRSTARYAMGLLRRSQGRFAEAKIELETAITLDRNNAKAKMQLGSVLMLVGQPEAAIAKVEEAIRLNPHESNLVGYYWVLAVCHLFLGNVDEAIDLFRKARAENPGLWYTHLWLAGALGFRGDLDEARAEAAEATKLKPEVNSVARWRAGFVDTGFGNVQFQALLEKTVFIGIRRAGFPDE